jgi:roadblock/LC7 domain-containing protein
MVIVAKSLDELLRLKGVIASGEFAPNGKLLEFRSKGTPLPDDVALLADQFAAAVNQLLGALAAANSRLSGLLGVLAACHGRISGVNLAPEQGWAYSGGDLTIAVGGGRGVFAKTSEADFNQLFEALGKPWQQSAVGDR